MATIRIKQIRSRIGCLQKQKRILDALGLRKIGRVVEHEANGAILGMVDKVRHLVEEIVPPRIIADTNIWYLLGENQELFEKVKDNLHPIYNNLWELATTGNLSQSSKEVKVRKAIQKVMLCSNKMIIEEPLKYLIKSANKDYQAPVFPLTTNMMNFTAKIANGEFLKEEQKEDYYKYVKGIKQRLDEIKKDFSEMAVECKTKIKDLQQHRKQDTIEKTIQFVNFMAERATEGKYNLKQLPLDDYELFILVMDAFFKKIETGETKWQRNDSFDLFNLAYVGKGDKYWTKEKKWIEIIKEVGAEKYLYRIR
jgi:ribosomal protein L30